MLSSLCTSKSKTEFFDNHIIKTSISKEAGLMFAKKIFDAKLQDIIPTYTSRQP